MKNAICVTFERPSGMVAKTLTLMMHHTFLSQEGASMKCAVASAAVLSLFVGHGAVAAEKLSTPTLSRARSGGAVSAGTGQPWLLSDDERISRRFATPDVNLHGQTESRSAGYREAVDGRQHPELFLPYELFDSLLGGVSSNPKIEQNAHAVFDSRIRAFGYEPAAFWSALRMLSKTYLSAKEVSRMQRRNSTLIPAADGSKLLIPIGRDVCSARISALISARKEFGGKEFDRLLYSAVAPEVSITSSGSFGGRPEQLRYMARGCR